jgi:teichuronic acid biosynthesis glycosyltransferase TuaG
MKEALVSVVMPAYNAEKYIEQAIRSVQNQSYSNWELLICDDCSSDNTTHIIKKYQKKDDRIKLFELKKNSGVTIARNTSLENSIGKYIAFLDSDDYWLKDKLSVQIKFMESKNISFSCTTYGIVRGDEILNKSFFALEELDYKSYMKNTSIGNSTVVINKLSFPNFSVEDGPLEDVVTWMKLLKAGNICYGIVDKLGMYRVTKNSASGNKLKNAKLYFLMLLRVQKIGFFKSVFYELNYMFNAVCKRLIKK